LFLSGRGVVQNQWDGTVPIPPYDSLIPTRSPFGLPVHVVHSHELHSELKNERDDSLNSFLVAGVLIGELFAHHLFFVVQFDPKA
jgi:hypothetical protein